MAPTRTPKAQPTATRRAGTARPRPGRPVAAPTARRTPAFPSRRKPAPQQSNAKKVFGAVTTALPGLIEKAGQPAKKAKPSSRKGGAGLALLGAGAAAAALKNRDKLPRKLGGRSSSTQEVQPVATVPTTPVTPVTPVGNADGPGTTPLA